MEKAVVIVQARMTSTRLPGKVLMSLKGKPVLEHVIDRLKQSKQIDAIVIATTTNQSDDCIVELCNKCNVEFYRGSENDVLSRYYNAAKEQHADIVIRVTSDCPLIDACILDDMLAKVKQQNICVMTNAGIDQSKRTFPRGLDIEIFRFEVLEQAYKMASELYQREHVTPYIYETSSDTSYYQSSIDYSEHRWTLDTEEDFKVIQSIYDELYQGEHDFYMKDILEYLEKHPEVKEINQHIEQKYYKY